MTIAPVAQAPTFGVSRRHAAAALTGLGLVGTGAAVTGPTVAGATTQQPAAVEAAAMPASASSGERVFYLPNDPGWNHGQHPQNYPHGPLTPYYYSEIGRNDFRTTFINILEANGKNAAYVNTDATLQDVANYQSNLHWQLVDGVPLSEEQKKDLMLVDWIMAPNVIADNIWRQININYLNTLIGGKDNRFSSRSAFGFSGEGFQFDPIAARKAYFEEQRKTLSLDDLNDFAVWNLAEAPI
ncbi:MAG: hypothetical protein AB7P76_05390 [Candidatus Melainabacteria bacterium]